jgi:fructosamine-3-kinase
MTCALVESATGVSVESLTPIAGGSICRAWRVMLADGRTVFAKSHPDPPPEFFRSEARGLAWLAYAGAVPLPEVLGVGEDVLVLSWIPAGTPSAAAAAELGRGLAMLHQAGAPSFGAGWPGYIGELPMDNTPSGSWPDFYVRRRLEPYVRQARDAGSFSAEDVAIFERLGGRVAELAGPEELPARIHGDLWSGNVVWSDRAVLVDPAAHGGHRENDLAMLALFGAPYLAEIMAGYQEVWPLADGWAERVGLHQLQPLLVHTVLFGGGYGAQAVATARQYL